MATLKIAHVFDVLQLHSDERVIGVPFAVNERKNGSAIFPTIFARQPSRRFRQEHHHEEEENCWYHLKAPRHTEGCCLPVVGLLPTDEGAAVRDVIHDEDAERQRPHQMRGIFPRNWNESDLPPSDCPLLHADEAAALGWR